MLGYSLDHVRLPEGNFDTRLASVRMQWNFTTELIWTHFVQFDSDTDTIGYNSRIQWEVAPGSFLYVVLNQNLDRDDGNVRSRRA